MTTPGTILRALTAVAKVARALIDFFTTKKKKKAKDEKDKSDSIHKAAHSDTTDEFFSNFPG